MYFDEGICCKKKSETSPRKTNKRKKKEKKRQPNQPRLGNVKIAVVEPPTQISRCFNALLQQQQCNAF